MTVIYIDLGGKFKEKVDLILVTSIDNTCTHARTHTQLISLDLEQSACWKHMFVHCRSISLKQATREPGMSTIGKLRTGTKSDLLGCLEDREFTQHTRVQVTIIDGAAIVNMLRPGAARKFSDYANQVFIPYILSQLQHVNRVDVKWDEYLPDSLKAETRKRGKGARRCVEPIPGNWQEFLRI